MVALIGCVGGGRVHFSLCVSLYLCSFIFFSGRVEGKGEIYNSIGLNWGIDLIAVIRDVKH